MNPLPQTDFPRVIDNTMRSDFVACPKKFWWRYCRNLGAESINVHLHAGGAFARAMEVTRREFYSSNCNSEAAIARGLAALLKYWGTYEPLIDTPKTLDRMAGALEYYFSVYPLELDGIKPVIGKDGAPAVEFNFILPLDIKHPQTGDPILYSGRFDMLGQRETGGMFVVDEKTTTQLGNSWLAKWRLRSQFTGYCWGARQYDYPVSGFIVRGISILKHSYGSLEYIGYRPQWHVDMWYTQLLRDIKRMIQQWNDNYFDYALADACGEYGGCMFTPLCDSPNPELWTSTYPTKIWDPLKVF